MAGNHSRRGCHRSRHSPPRSPLRGQALDKDLEAGKLKATVTIPALRRQRRGRMSFLSKCVLATKLLAQGSIWMGKVAARKTPLDVCFVLPVSLGIHRDWTRQVHRPSAGERHAARGVKGRHLARTRPDGRPAFAMETDPSGGAHPAHAVA